MRSTSERFLEHLRQVRHRGPTAACDRLWAALRPCWRLAGRLATRDRGFVHLVNGTDRLRITLDHAPNAEAILWEAEQYRAVMAEIRPGTHFMDVGAFIGLYALGAALRVGAAGRVIAIEPSPRTVRLLRANIRGNDFERVIQVVDEVCADRSGEPVDFYVDPQGAMIDSAVSRPERKAAVIRRHTTTIDDLVSRFGLRPSVLKIDVEGFEDCVVEGAADTVRRFRPVVFLEFHPRELSLRSVSPLSVIGRLADWGLHPDDPALGRGADVPAGVLFAFRPGTSSTPGDAP